MPDIATETTAALDASDPYARETQTFPRLNEEMIQRISAFGSEEFVPDGGLLFERGQRGADFFVVVEGEIEIFETDIRGAHHVVTTQRAGQFTGEMDLFNDRQILVSGRARGAVRTLRVKRSEFRRLIAVEADIGELIMRAFILRRVGFIRHTEAGVTLIGPRHAGDTQRLASFMVRNAYPHKVYDTEDDPDAHGFLSCFELRADELPVLILPGGVVMRNPKTTQLADALGLTETVDADKVYDVAVIGAGPAGLAAAVYASSEGLSTLVLEAIAPGGQAGTSSKIENYLGFPTGISGQALAGRAQAQAQKFGARLAISRAVRALHCADQGPFVVELEDGTKATARAVIVATGARYRKLDVENYSRFEGQGVHYAATNMESQLCAGEDVVVVGGGNSAGQAAVFLSRTVAHVHVVIRSDALSATMSDYLVRRLETSPRITIHPHREITALSGERFLESVTWTDKLSGSEETRTIRNLFVMIGAEPNTDWALPCLALDAQGFVVTGFDAQGNRLPSPYATSRPGVFAVGDVRSGSVKRVASSVGEGSVVIQAVHAYLQPHEH